jgi:hypothetical protein
MAYSDEQKTEIINKACLRISEGERIRDILAGDDMPSTETFFKWLSDDDVKAKQYAYACEVRAENIFDEMIEIADDGTNDFMKKQIGEGLEIEVLNSEHIQRSRLRIDTRKWMLSKLNPKKFGDKVDLTSAGEKIEQSVTIFELPSNGRA